MKQPKPQLTLHDCVASAKLINTAVRGLMLLALLAFTMQSFAIVPCNHAAPSAPDSTADMAGCHDSADKLESLAVHHASSIPTKADCCDSLCPMNACHFGGIVVNTYSLPFYSITNLTVLAPVMELPSAPAHFIFRPPIFA